MEHVQHVIKQIEPHDSVERYSKLGVDCINGEATILDPHHVQVNETIITTKNIIVATGASPFVPDITGIENINYLTSDNLWNIRELPKKLLVLGGGAIGCELSQAFARLGSNVTQVEQASRLLAREDDDVSNYIENKFAEDNINVLTNHLAKEFLLENGKQYLLCDNGIKIEFDAVIIAVGRKANVNGFGLEKLDVHLTERKAIDSDAYLRTNYPNIFICGDVAGKYQFTHTAAHQAWYASVNALFAPLKKFKVDYSIIPWCIFTDPEIAHVGINEQEAKEKNIPYEVTKYDISDLDRAIMDGNAKGFVKVLTVPNKDTILGVTIVGNSAGELIAEFVIAMKNNIGLKKILGTIHIYPTMAEANKYVAGCWQQNHKPQFILKLLKKFHEFRRR
jgi:pyruvate/2-oxoglutarate dehydrogenase complex dihydrolipoamide dehydrogenase (E3) component